MDSVIDVVNFLLAVFFVVLAIYSFVYENKVKNGQPVQQGFLYQRLAAIMDNWQARNANFWIMVAALTFLCLRAMLVLAVLQVAMWVFVAVRFALYHKRFQRVVATA